MKIKDTISTVSLKSHIWDCKSPSACMECLQVIATVSCDPKLVGPACFLWRVSVARLMKKTLRLIGFGKLNEQCTLKRCHVSTCNICMQCVDVDFKIPKDFTLVNVMCMCTVVGRV